MDAETVDDEPGRDEIELPPVLAALADPTRLGMVAKLAAADELPCGALTTCVTKSTASHHLKVLREAGIISQRPCGVARMNRLRASDLEARFPGLLSSIVAAAEGPGAAVSSPAADASPQFGFGPRYST